MELKEILSKCDHTLLSQTATWEEIRALCDDGMKYGCASVCIPASYVKQAAEYVAGKLPICTVIGFPNGYDTTAAKCFMATDAVNNGAEEVDMVINIGWVKDQKWDAVLSEIRGGEGGLQRPPSEGHHRVLLPHRRGKSEDVRDRHRFRCGVYQDLHGLRHRRRHPGGCGALCPACGSPGEDQGGRRYRRFEGRGGFYRPGCLPPGYQPHRQGCQGHGGLNNGNASQEAANGAFAKTVLMPGDPLRAKFIAETFLEDAQLVNHVRGVNGYTGTYRGTPVSVMASGMGMPSIGIYSP